jgi:two-component system chemotaxis response regulator CheY
MPRRVLIVDDSPAMRNVIARSVRICGWAFEEYLFAGDGFEALKILAESPADVILTDINMAGMDGEGLVRALQSDPALCSIPVVVLSTDATHERRRMMLALGVKGYICKPFSPEMIHGELTRLLGPAYA